MRVNWPYHRCVLCLRAPDPAQPGTRLTFAHLIPASIGGRLEVSFLCFDCNSLLGRTVEKGLKADPAIASCIQAVLAQLPPAVRKKLLRGMTWLAETERGLHVNGALDEKGRFRPRETSEFLSHENAKAMLESGWRNLDLTQDEAQAHFEAIEASVTTGSFVHLQKGAPPAAVDPATLAPRPDWDANLIPDTLPLSIAFLYLCFYLGSTAYRAEPLQPVREALLTNDSRMSGHWQVEPRRHASGCRPEHRLWIKELAPVVVHVELFREWVWWVKFPRVGVTKAPPADYGIDISTGGGEFTW